MFGLFRMPRSKKDFITGIIYTVIAIICFIGFSQLLIYAIIFTGLAVFKFFYFNKHRKCEEKAEELLDQLNTDSYGNTKKERVNVRKISSSEKKKRKQEYDEYLNKIENELGDFDEEEYINANINEEEDSEEDEEESEK